MLEIDSVAFHAPTDTDALCQWLTWLGWAHVGELAERDCFHQTPGGLCVEVSARWSAPSSGRPYWRVADMDAFHRRCVDAGVEVLLSPRPTGDGTWVMEIGGPGGVSVTVLEYEKPPPGRWVIVETVQGVSWCMTQIYDSDAAAMEVVDGLRGSPSGTHSATYAVRRLAEGEQTA